MNIHEYQSKQILKEFGVKVPNGSAAFSPEEAARFAKDLSTDVVVVKAQIHAGGRGKAGGVKLAHNIDEVKSYASALPVLSPSVYFFCPASVRHSVAVTVISPVLAGVKLLPLTVPSSPATLYAML